MPMYPMPIERYGACPSGYFQQAKMCVPTAAAKPVIKRNGACPPGWHQSGEDCVANEVNPKIGIPKNGVCPSGYFQSGNYVIQK